ncbi:MAG: hypothetical protein JWM99_1442 [Verrucomicrobiales bacterium]|nr:hypothetical protein [Verrucomicrobiales bacterium]
MERTKISMPLIAALLAFSVAGELIAQETSAGAAQAGTSAAGITIPIVNTSIGSANKKPERPSQSDKPTIPEDVKSRLDQFKVAREAFLANQKDLTRKLKDATQDERDKIREQIQLQKQQFKAQAKELAQQAKESARDLDTSLGHKVGQEGGTVGHGGRPDR